MFKILQKFLPEIINLLLTFYLQAVFICMQIKEIGSCYLFDLVSLF